MERVATLHLEREVRRTHGSHRVVEEQSLMELECVQMEDRNLQDGQDKMNNDVNSCEQLSRSDIGEGAFVEENSFTELNAEKDCSKWKKSVNIDLVTREPHCGTDDNADAHSLVEDSDQIVDRKCSDQIVERKDGDETVDRKGGDEVVYRTLHSADNVDSTNHEDLANESCDNERTDNALDKETSFKDR